VPVADAVAAAAVVAVVVAAAAAAVAAAAVVVVVVVVTAANNIAVDVTVSHGMTESHLHHYYLQPIDHPMTLCCSCRRSVLGW